MEYIFIVHLQNPAHAGAELLHQAHILEYAHELAVARHARKAEKVLLALPVDEAAVRCDLHPVRKDLKHGRDLARVIVVNDGVDDRLTQRHAPDKSAVDALLARDLGAGDVLDLELIQNAVRRLDERTIAIFLVLNEIDLIPARILGDFDGNAVLVGKKVSHIVILAVGREQFKRACKLIIKGKPALFIIRLFRKAQISLSSFSLSFSFSSTRLLSCNMVDFLFWRLETRIQTCLQIIYHESISYPVNLNCSSISFEFVIFIVLITLIFA